MDGKVGSWFVFAMWTTCAACSSTQAGAPADAGSSVADSFTETGTHAEGGAPMEAGPPVEAGAPIEAGGGNDAGAPCPAPPGNGVCDIVPACGCTAAQNCVRIDGGPEECAPNGSIGPLGNCVGQSDCQHGLSCANGVCDPACATAADCPANYACLAQFNTPPAGQSVALGYDVCVPHCNPVFPTQTDALHVACGADQQCYTVYLEGTWMAVCAASTGSLGEGAACTYAVDCQPGYFCISGGSAPNTCQKYCRVGMSDCTTGSCVAFGTPVYDINGTYSQELGFCQ